MMKLKKVTSLPAPVLRRYDHVGIGDQLRKSPDEWHKIDRGATNRIQALATQWRKRRPAGFGEGHFEFVAISCGHGTGEAKLFGRYLDN